MAVSTCAPETQISNVCRKNFFHYSNEQYDVAETQRCRGGSDTVLLNRASIQLHRET